MGGIGKTTLATALFNKISPQYDACCYIDDLSKIYFNFGATSAQKQLLCQALNQGNMEIHNVSRGTMLMKSRLCRLKTLLVLDNVDEVEHLEKLGLRPEYLGAGSRLIIISRDRCILQSYGVKEVYDVQLLDKIEALQLFCKKAFKSNDIGREHEELTLDVLQYANGLPLAIKVLGSLLHDRDVSEWRNALARMKENPSKHIMDVLRISYDALENLEKEIFLDIACFFSNRNNYSYETRVKRLLEYRQFYPDIGMKVLIEKSLISCQDGEIEMHDLLKELGKSIVREKAPKEPRKWNRLWNYKDLQKVMKINKETENVEAIVIHQSEKEFLEDVDALSKMNQLELLILENVNCSGTLDCISNELRYLQWNHFPLMSLPSNFHPDQLVELILPHSNIKKLWEGKKFLPNLTMLDMSHSKYLIAVPDLSEVPRLESLDLEGCIQLVEIHPSIGILRELRCLNLKNCKNLVLNLNMLFGISSLSGLYLSGCSKLLNSKMLMEPRDTKHLEEIVKITNAIQFPTSSVYKLLMLPFNFLYPPKPEDSLGLVLSLSSVPCLVYLDISFCNLLRIPDEIGNLHSLVGLNLGGNKFVTLPSTIKQLSNLERLYLEYCKQLKYLPELPTIKQKNIGGYYGLGLYIFDCTKLSDMEHCYSMVFSWMTQNLQVFFQPTISSARIEMEIVIPGSEIPKWFNKQSASTSISMDPSDVIDDPNWIGVAICVLFVTLQDPMNLGERDDDHLSNLWFGVNNSKRRWYIGVPIYFKKDLVTVGLDHLVTVFYSRQQFIHLLSTPPNTMHDLYQTEFGTFIHHPKGLRIVVKKCGYRWVFKEDLQQFNSNMFFSTNSSSRKRKLLTSD
ncbi:disease resistance protein RPP4-like isoform X1 [Vigna unguiculata]|uniref:disease resistance protein RPP4-like isoform X1 n=1 Tax=Vigna unguiculata TaxID=3917 RepID=UPI0010168378|nr:disease resistance protein RPP4-like isoform X1 [Vigna unguiculata]